MRTPGREAPSCGGSADSDGKERGMRRAVVGYEVAIVAEGRRARAVPAEPRGRRLFVSAALLVAAALFSVWLSGQYYRIGYAVSAAYEERRALEREQERLRTEILALRNPA